MVEQYVRWDFIGLSTDSKPTSENEKVTDGSTYYESDTSKYYVYYKGTWYEKQDTGGGGTSDFEDLTNRPKYQGSAMTGETDIVAFTGTDGEANGTAGLVPAPQTTDEGKFLKADGTWGTAGGKLYDTIGTNTDGAMTQKAVTEMIYPDDIGDKIRIGHSANATVGENSTVIGHSADGSGYEAVALGDSAVAKGSQNVVIGYVASSYGTNNTVAGCSASVTPGYQRSVAIGYGAVCGASNSIALGVLARTTIAGEVNVGTPGNYDGYNNTSYRIINGVHDGINNHCAATVAQGNTLATSAPTTSTEGVLGQLYTDTTNMHTYQCTAISGNTYTWTQRW